MSAARMPRASVVIPAHNEEGVLGRCLDALLVDLEPGEFEIIVAANGCTDGTVDIARGRAEVGVRLVETSEASKVAALNLGDAQATTVPRIYLDADVVVAGTALRALTAVLSASDGPLAAAPRLRLNTARSSRPARAYLRVWESLPGFAESYVGSGCYAVSGLGRSRFGAFPNVVGDDRFVNSLFAREEKLTLSEHTMDVTAPTTLRGVVRRSVRVRSGTAVLNTVMADEGYDIADPGTGSGTRSYLISLVKARKTAVPALVFVMVQMWVRLASRAWILAGKDRIWLRDETSRT